MRLHRRHRSATATLPFALISSLVAAVLAIAVGGGPGQPVAAAPLGITDIAVTSPTASPSPTGTPTPSAVSGSPSPSPTAATGTGPVVSPPPSPRAPSAAATPNAAGISATFENAPFLGQLLDVLAHPSSAQPPDLRHFRLDDIPGDTTRVASAPVPAASTAAVAGQPAAAQPPAPPHDGGAGAGLLAAAAIVATLLAVAITDGARRSRRRPASGAAVVCRPTQAPASRPRRSARRRLTTLVLCAMAPLTAWADMAGSAARHSPVALGSPAPHSTGAATATVATSARPFPRLREEATAEAIQAVLETPPAWRQLLSVEDQLTSQQDELAAQEGRIAVLAQVVAQRPAATADDPATPPPMLVAPQPGAELSALVAAHAALLGAYQHSLQAEYDVYRAAAQDPQQGAQLLAGAAQRGPDVAAAVSFDLGLVQTQLSQEAAIEAAEDRLRTFGGLSQGQLRAIREHQAFVVPLEAPVTQGFGPTDFSLEPPLTYQGVFYPHFHTGIDLAAPLDTPVHAAADGVVLLATANVDASGNLTGYGNYVVVSHPDGFETLYAHLESLAVAAGDVVRQGQIIGLEGSTGTSTGPHLHFEIRHDGDFLDPAGFLTGQLQYAGSEPTAAAAR